MLADQFAAAAAAARNTHARRASIERRRRQAMSGVVPAKIAAAFTMAELAVLTVIARQCQRTGVCVLPVDAIAALAGCCRTVVKNAMRQARLLGLLLVKERRTPGLPSTNVVRIVSKDWIGWLKLGGGIGVRSATPTGSQSSIRGRKPQVSCLKRPPATAVSAGQRPSEAVAPARDLGAWLPEARHFTSLKSPAISLRCEKW